METERWDGKPEVVPGIDALIPICGVSHAHWPSIFLSPRHCPLWQPLATRGHLNVNVLHLIFSPSVTQATFCVLNCHMWLVATSQASVAVERFHHHRKFCETILLQKILPLLGQIPLGIFLGTIFSSRLLPAGSLLLTLSFWVLIWSECLCPFPNHMLKS